MKRNDRQQAIMDLLMADREVELDYLADLFSVSKMTIHRDLDELEGAGLLRKIRGGATIEAGTRFESDFRFRELQGAAAKSTIAEAALALVEPGMTVMINDGSMAAVLGRMIPARRPLTVITNNLAVIDVLKAEPGITLIALGGVYSAKFNAFLGKVCEDSLTHLRADIAFISTPAVTGLEVFHMDDEVVRVKRAMMASSGRRCLMVNHLRFGHAALHKLADLHEFDSIITDRLPAADTLDPLRAANLPLTIAHTKEATT
ncbi:DeoR/GlpR family DNA-binding transcription regulator [Roseinatronobacter sp. S2]|uniref:DeoR/GlpR family DNA-binding transcription regulator n=1 Tax=Roseinatronobacter sp. S2 TaxID=3035471 RepID=UPI00240F6F68|nr:DeoR/GlpR family DNA-binding transcription regulator [Roseinatronobacter sp. S2]WFE76510.1 DeoR/GlpR family DNA-binding transcription regulator [Roseinatronobacter sp. S2]